MKIPILNRFLDRKFQNTSYEVWFLKKNSEKYIVLDKKKLKLDRQDQITKVSYKDKTFIIPEQASLEDKNKNLIMFDYDNNKIIAFNKIELGYDPKLIDQLLVKQIIAQITAKIKSAIGIETKGKIGTYIMVAVAFLLGGYVLGTIYPMQNVAPKTKMLEMLIKWL